MDPSIDCTPLRFDIPIDSSVFRIGALCLPHVASRQSSLEKRADVNSSMGGGVSGDHNHLEPGARGADIGTPGVCKRSGHKEMSSNSFFSTGCPSISPTGSRSEVIISSMHASALRGATIGMLHMVACSRSREEARAEVMENPYSPCIVRVLYDHAVAEADLLLSQTAFTSCARPLHAWTLTLDGNTEHRGLDSMGAYRFAVFLRPYLPNPPIRACPRVIVHYQLNRNLLRSHTQTYSEGCIQQIIKMAMSGQIVDPALFYTFTPWLAARCCPKQEENPSLSFSSAPSHGEIYVSDTETMYEFVRVEHLDDSSNLSGSVNTGVMLSREVLFERLTEHFAGSRGALRRLSGLIADCSAGSARHGALLVGAHGSGKSLLVKSIFDYLGVSSSVVVDCRDFAELHRGVAESIILNLPNKLTSEHRVLVLENIDEFTTRSSSGESIRDTNDMSMSDAFLTDALNQCIDAVVSRFPTCFILATSAVGAEAVSKAEKQGSLHVDQGVTQMHRLGSVLHLQPLGKADRAELIHSMLSLIEDNGEVFIDETVEKFLMNLSSNLLPTKELQRCDYMNMLSKEIASRTPGLSALDLISLIKLHTQEISTESAKPGRVSISAAKLLTASAEATPSDVISGASRDVFQLMNDVSDAAELPGYENILQELVDETLGFYSGPLEVREMYHRLGLTPTSGIVISGPSGVGKTALARLLGKRCQNYFKFISVSCAELVHKVVGETEQKLTQLFASARAMAPCFVLLDNLEIIMGGDPIAPSGDSNMRSDDGDVEGLPETEEAKRLRMSHLFNSKRTSSQAFDRLLSTLLIEIDGIGPLGALRNEGSSIAYRDDLKGGSLSADDMYNQGPVIVIATTTDASLLDSALTRPGRLEKHVQLSLPSAAQRRDILKYLLKGLVDTAVVDISRLVDDVVAKTERRSPSALHEVVVGATMVAVREAVGSAMTNHPTNPSPNEDHSTPSAYQVGKPHSWDESPYLNEGMQSRASDNWTDLPPSSFYELNPNETKIANHRILLYPRHFSILFI